MYSEPKSYSFKKACFMSLMAGLLFMSQTNMALADEDYIKIKNSKNVVTRTVNLGKDKTLVIDLPRNARDILIGNPEIAEVVARSARKSYVIGKTLGSTNIIYFDASNRRIANIIINVEPDVAALAHLFEEKMPNSRIHVEAMNGNIVLSGQVKSASQVGRAVSIAGKYINRGAVTTADQLDTKNVINMLTYNAREQVMLKVSIVEMQRSSVKQLGIDLSISGGIGSSSISFNNNNPYTLGSTSGGVASSLFSGGTSVTIKALETIGVVRTLAEPVLTTISGEAASFLAGGEFPVPSGYDADTDTVSIEYKPIGVGLTFTPVVLDGGRISLKVSTEVSSISQEDAFAINNNLTLPSIKVRRATTTVELPTGGSLVLAGLIQESTKKTISGIPFFKDVPIIGSLFRSVDFINNETELVIIATPYLVDPVADHELARPDAGFKVADDFHGSFMGQINAIYGNGDASGSASNTNLAGDFGFVDGE
ncbi:MAG: type II and III secretion system protein family protein [Alphaproteobacteria bacterium]|nr:type II and III secretion system protein family protein [Alphaproteobacteria bacterium]